MIHCDRFCQTTSLSICLITLQGLISTVYNIINGRYEAYLPTIVTTNYDTEALIDRMTPRESHDSMTARATIDRLMEMCRGITLTGQSWRSR